MSQPARHNVRWEPFAPIGRTTPPQVVEQPRPCCRPGSPDDLLELGPQVDPCIAESGDPDLRALRSGVEQPEQDRLQLGRDRDHP